MSPLDGKWFKENVLQILLKQHQSSNNIKRKRSSSLSNNNGDILQ